MTMTTMKCDAPPSSHFRRISGCMRKMAVSWASVCGCPCLHLAAIVGMSKISCHNSNYSTTETKANYNGLCWTASRRGPAYFVYPSKISSFEIMHAITGQTRGLMWTRIRWLDRSAADEGLRLPCPALSDNITIRNHFIDIVKYQNIVIREGELWAQEGGQPQGV